MAQKLLRGVRPRRLDRSLSARRAGSRRKETRRANKQPFPRRICRGQRERALAADAPTSPPTTRRLPPLRPLFFFNPLSPLSQPPPAGSRAARGWSSRAPLSSLFRAGRSRRSARLGHQVARAARVARAWPRARAVCVHAAKARCIARSAPGRPVTCVSISMNHRIKSIPFITHPHSPTTRTHTSTHLHTHFHTYTHTRVSSTLTSLHCDRSSSRKCKCYWLTHARAAHSQ